MSLKPTKKPLPEQFIKIESLLPTEVSQGGLNLTIRYEFSQSPFGKIMIASTSKGICYLAFDDESFGALNDIKLKFPKAIFLPQSSPFHQPALSIFDYPLDIPSTLNLHVKGTDFQLHVWRQLLKIPFGQVSSYQQLAQRINLPKASRAVGNAIGKNPVAFLIPCHRVIQSSGRLGGYMWGITRKSQILAWEKTTYEMML